METKISAFWKRPAMAGLVTCSLALAGCGGGGGSTDAVAGPADAAASAPTAGTTTTPTPATPTAPVLVSSCAALKSGKYRLLAPADDTSPISTVELDATSPKVAGHGFSALDGKPCAFTADAGATRLVVSPAGVGVMTFTDAGGTGRLALLVPDQTVALGELAGSWNWTYFQRLSPAALTLARDVDVLDGAGRMTAGQHCAIGTEVCTAWAPDDSATLVADAVNGGFSDRTGAANRLFPVKAASGEIVLLGVQLGDKGVSKGLIVVSRPTPLALPVAGSVQRFFGAGIGPDWTGSSFYDREGTISAVDSATASFTRLLKQDSVDEVATEVMHINKPRDGFLFRDAQSVGDSTRLDSTFLPLPVIGLTLETSNRKTGTSWVNITIERP